MRNRWFHFNEEKLFDQVCVVIIFSYQNSSNNIWFSNVSHTHTADKLLKEKTGKVSLYNQICTHFTIISN